MTIARVRGLQLPAAPCLRPATNAWLEDTRVMIVDDDQLLRDAYRLRGIPGVLVHGRLDLSRPLLTAWELAQAWPDAELTIIEDSGHTGSPTMGNRRP
jgi:proline iminopeptidase